MANNGKKGIPSQEIKKEIEAAEIHPPTALEKKVFGLLSAEKNGRRKTVFTEFPYVVLRYFRPGFECFSAWGSVELKAFSNFVEVLGQQTWESVYRSGGKPGTKTGLGYTQYKIDEMKTGAEHLKAVSSLLSEDVGFFELRLSDRVRVHGFQAQSAFFLVLLDKDHRVFP